MKELRVLLLLAVAASAPAAFSQTLPEGVVDRLALGTKVRALCVASDERNLLAGAWPRGRVLVVERSATVCVRESLSLTGTDRVGALAAQGNRLWVLAGGELKRFEVRPHCLEPKLMGKWPRSGQPRGLTVWKGMVLTSFPPYREITCLDPETLEKNGTIPTPAGRICALSHDRRNLYVGDGRDDRIHVLRRGSWDLIKVLVPPITGLRDVAAVSGGRLFCTFQGIPDVVEVRTATGPHVGPVVQQTVALWLRASNTGKRAVKVEMALPVAESNERQTVHWLRRFGVGSGRLTRKGGAGQVEVRTHTLRGGETASCCWIAGVSVRRLAVNYSPAEVASSAGSAVQGLPPVDAGALRRYGLNSKILKEVYETEIASRQSPIDRVDAIIASIGRRLRYKMDGRWSHAERVLKQGHGSCSEYTYVSLGLLRMAGLPARYVGATLSRKPDKAGVSEDWAGHRWPECRLIPYGWVPFDPTWSDGRSPNRKFLLATSARHLVLVRAIAGKGPLKWRYRGLVRSRLLTGPVLHHRYTLWLPRVDARDLGRAVKWVWRVARGTQNASGRKISGVNEDFLAEVLLALLPEMTPEEQDRVLIEGKKGDASLVLLERIKLHLGREFPGKRSLKESQRESLVRWIRDSFQEEDPYRKAALRALQEPVSPAEWQKRFFKVRKSIKKGKRRRFP